MNGTHITHEITDYKKLAKRVLKAISQLVDNDCGTVAKPVNEASIVLSDGRTIIQTIAEDGYISYTDGYLIVEADGYTIYVDYSGQALKEYNFSSDYKYVTNIQESEN